jgi:hypothetical protein
MYESTAVRYFCCIEALGDKAVRMPMKIEVVGEAASVSIANF